MSRCGWFTGLRSLMPDAARGLAARDHETVRLRLAFYDRYDCLFMISL